MCIDLKKSALVIVFMIAISSCSNSKVYFFNDWSEKNLKDEPKYILESSSFTPNDLLTQDDSIQKWWFERPLGEWFSHEEFYFDEDGFVIPQESQGQDNDSVFGKETVNRILTKDTIWIISQYEEFPHSNSEMYILDEIGLPYKKIVEIWDRPMSIDSFIRDSHNHIIEIYSKSSGIDDYGKSHTQFSLNSLGDPIEEIHSQWTFTFLSMDTLYSADTVHYKYIYDDHSNWIIKTEILDGRINRIFQRTIKY